MGVLDCETCNTLLADYQRCVEHLVDVGIRFRAVRGDSFLTALKELKRLRERCQDADDALMAHWSTEHGSLAGT
jgi:hypothetical protein